MKNLQRPDEYRRYRAVELMERGEPKESISRILGVSLVTLNKWQERSRRGEDLNTKICSGRPRTISDEQLTELSRLLSEGAVAHGWENNLWTSPTNLVTSFFIYKSCGPGCCWQSVI